MNETVLVQAQDSESVNVQVQDTQAGNDVLNTTTESQVETTITETVSWDQLASSKEDVIELGKPFTEVMITAETSCGNCENCQCDQSTTLVAAEETAQPIIESQPTQETQVQKPHASKKKKHSDKKKNDTDKPVDVTPLLHKFGKPTNRKDSTMKSNTQRAALLVAPKDLRSNTYITEIFKKSVEQAQEYSTDSEDHINASAVGKTQLGKFLDLNAKAPFNHPQLGQFQSVGGLWFFVRTEDHAEIFRHIWGGKCREEGFKYKGKLLTVPGFRVIIADATWIKVLSNPHMAKAMAESTLPFKNYYYSRDLGLQKDTPEAVWYCRVLEAIRTTLKKRIETGDESLQPDFGFLEPRYPKREVEQQA